MSTTTFLVGIAAFSSCIELPPGDMKDPQYWGDVFLDKFEDERRAAVENIEPGPGPLEHPRTVLLITGVTIPAEWFDPIKLRLERDGFKPVVYEPPDLLSGSLYENSELLGELIERLAIESGEGKIDVLAECTGGLITRHYIQALGGDQYVRRLVTFISPQHGVDKAPLAASIAGWPALYDLSPGSDFLEEVNGDDLPDSVAVTSIYTCTDEYIQPWETSIIPGATNIGLGCDGEFVGHYQFFYDPEIYLVMHGALTEPVPGSPDPGDPGAPGDPGTPGDDPADPSDPSDDTAAGCSAGRGAGGGAGLALIGVALVAGLRRRRTR